jgi:cell division protein FtsQ
MLSFVTTVLAVLSLTVLFNIKTIQVEGQTRYSQEQIINSSGVKTEQNLLRVNSKKVMKNISNQLPYAEHIVIKKKLPDLLVIQVKEPDIQAVVQNEKPYIISGMGRVLDDNPQSTEGIVAFEGLAIDTVNRCIIAEDLEKLARICVILNEIRAQGIEKVTSIRADSVTESDFVFDGRVKVKLGSPEDLVYKIRFSSYLMKDKIGITEIGELDATQPGKGSFSPKEASVPTVNSQASSVTQGSSGQASSATATVSSQAVSSSIRSSD